MEGSLSAGNASTGVVADGADTVVHLSNTTATQNAPGVSAVNGGSILSFGNNRIARNTIDGSVSATVPLQ